MKKFILALVAIVTFQIAKAQMPGAAPNQAPPSIGRIYGKLIDSTGKSIEGASIVVLQNKYDSATKKRKDVLLKGTISAANGDFNIEALPIMGPLKLTVSATGFEAYTQTVTFQPKMPAGAAQQKPANGQMPDMSAMASAFEKDLGKLSLVKSVKELSEVVVTATKGRLKMDIDKKVFSVDQNIVSAGGTAVDIMKNVPSVNVDIDGNVTMRNASPQIYIDGRPTTLSLDQIPADAIESVEIITNPSAKYDASGGNAGILNIVLKKNKKNGYNGNVNVGIDKRGAINGGASLNLRQNKFNLSLSGFGNQMKNRNTSSTDITSLLTTPNVLVNQTGSTIMNGGFLFGRAGVDYFATNRLTLSLSAVRVHGEFSPDAVLKTDSSYNNASYISFSNRTTATKREFNATGIQGGFKYLFPKEGEELTADFNIFNGRNSNNLNYNTGIYTYEGGAKTGEVLQQILGSGTNNFVTIQADYVKPFSKAGKIETGARVQLRTMTNNQSNYMFNNSTNEYVLVPNATSNYKNKDNVYAAYISVGNQHNNFGYKVGLRAESSDYTGELTDTKQSFSNKYPLSLFPSLFLSQKLSDKQELQFSVTRRVNRPFFMQVIPFIDSTDQLNWTRGNAALKPEFTNSAEVSYSKTFKGGNTVLVSAYYKYTTNLITRFLDTVTLASGEKRPISTYQNAQSSQSYGVEFTSQNVLTKWWDLNSNLNIYNSKINTDNITGTSQAAMWSWFAKVNNNFKLPADFKIQLSGTYQSKTNLPVNQNSGMGGPPMGGAQSAAQGYIKANWGIDAAISKSFLKNKAATVTFNVNDIFRTRKMDQYSASSFYIQNSYRLNDVPMFRINFAYKFGQMDMSLFKRKNMKAESEGSQGAMQGMQ
ncbi:TonB-dependent receptor [Lacibacter luteus]|uniref:TonB-dependent receptor n=1 Tax=Lacibacter luteus TaxID=2508719 RepID=A0A4Q1CHS3_9BACT|nr:TonB-dependent receptor [Lacibacter luteus]RXK59893.1 TonB-dependent receptor [Lacibacter luteus]